MKKNKTNEILLLAAACAALLTSCGNQTEITDYPAETGKYTEIASDVQDGNISENAINVNCSDITDEILSSVEMSSMAEVGSDRIELYIDFELPSECDFSMYICGSGGFADEICVINTKNIDQAALEEAVKNRIESRKKDFEGYNPDEYDKLTNFFSKSSNGYYIYAVTPDNAAVESIFDNNVK